MCNKSERAPLNSQRRIAELQQEGGTLQAELNSSRRRFSVLETRYRQLDASASKMDNLEQLRAEAQRAREAEQQLLLEAERLRPAPKKQRELEKLTLTETAELTYLRDTQPQADSASRRAAYLAEALEAEMDAVAELKEQVTPQKKEILHLRDRLLKSATAEPGSSPSPLRDSLRSSPINPLQHPNPDRAGRSRRDWQPHYAIEQQSGKTKHCTRNN